LWWIRKRDIRRFITQFLRWAATINKEEEERANIPGIHCVNWDCHGGTELLDQAQHFFI
jgi:hypothetical protein